MFRADRDLFEKREGGGRLDLRLDFEIFLNPRVRYGGIRNRSTRGGKVKGEEERSIGLTSIVNQVVDRESTSSGIENGVKKRKRDCARRE